MVINKRWFVCCLFMWFITHDTKAIGLAVGPSLGIAGFYTSMDGQHVISNRAIQLGGFAKLDLALFSLQATPLFVWDRRRVTTKIDRHSFTRFTCPITAGLSLSLLRLYGGIIFSFSLSDDAQFQGMDLVQLYRKKVNGWLFGIGVDLGNFVIDLAFERSFSSVKREKIDTILTAGSHTPKQFSLRVGYNLLGLFKKS